MDNRSGIYKILNKISGKIYIGSAVKLDMRWSQHKSKLKLNTHPNKYLQSSFNKNGLDNFEFLKLEYCEKDKLIEREQYWIDALNSCNREIGYNTRTVASSNIGVKCSEETKKLLSDKLKGKKVSEETKAKMSAWQVGRKMSKQARENMRLAKAGNSYKRNKSKWPCPDGSWCKCGDCKKLRYSIRDIRNNK